MTSKEKAILKRNLSLIFSVVAVVLVTALVAFIGFAAATAKNDNGISSAESTVSEASSSQITSSEEPEPEMVQLGEFRADANYQKLLLVNAQNPLPQDRDYESNLTEIPKEYIKGQLTKIDKDIWPFLKAMLDAAKSENIDIGVWSPYRSYEIQETLFKRQVEKQIKNGVPEAQAPDRAATVVARAGTSEHQTGLALDINSASTSFENTKAFEWLQGNAQNYGFIMRYPKEKQEITGVIYEPWHWRFVGINTAKEMNELNMCLEEYVEYKE